MSLWALLALKSPQQGKSRLSGALSRTQREQLVLAMLERVLGALDAADEVDEVAVITPQPEILPPGVIALSDPGTGLNQALLDGRCQAASRGASELLVLHADLPMLQAREVDRFIDASRRTGLGLAADHHGQGTNAVYMRLPSRFSFRFGTASFRQHLCEARNCGLEATVTHLPGFAMDVDEPSDLHALLDSQHELLVPFPAVWSTKRWTANQNRFLPSHAAEHG